MFGLSLSSLPSDNNLLLLDSHIVLFPNKATTPGRKFKIIAKFIE